MQCRHEEQLDNAHWHGVTAPSHLVSQDELHVLGCLKVPQEQSILEFGCHRWHDTPAAAPAAGTEGGEEGRMGEPVVIREQAPSSVWCGHGQASPPLCPHTATPSSVICPGVGNLRSLQRAPRVGVVMTRACPKPTQRRLLRPASHKSGECGCARHTPSAGFSHMIRSTAYRNTRWGAIACVERVGGQGGTVPKSRNDDKLTHVQACCKAQTIHHPHPRSQRPRAHEQLPAMCIIYELQC